MLTQDFRSTQNKQGRKEEVLVMKGEYSSVRDWGRMKGGDSASGQEGIGDEVRA
jgi:hypothetical protein